MEEYMPLFGAQIEPRCRYCSVGCWNKTQTSILCPKHGVMQPDAQCSAFCYDPLRRVPRRAPALPEMDPEDFRI